MNGALAGAKTTILRGAIAKPLVVGASGSITGTAAVQYWGSNNPTTVEDTTYTAVYFLSANVTCNLEGAIVTGLLYIRPMSGGTTVTLDTTAANHNITCGTLTVGTTGTQISILKCNDSTIDVGAGGITIGSSGSGACEIDADTSTIQTDGDWDSSAGTFTCDTSTVQITASCNVTLNGAQSGAFWNFIVDAGQTATVTAAYTYIDNVTTCNGAISSDPSAAYLLLAVNKAQATPLVMGGSGDISGMNAVYFRPNVNYNIPSTTYNRLLVATWGGVGNQTATPQGAINCNDSLIVYYSAIFDTDAVNNYGITCRKLQAGSGGNYGIINCNGSIIDVGTNGVLLSAAGDKINADTSIIQCAGNWANSGTFTCDSSTNIFTASASVDNNNQAFYNLYVDCGLGSTVTMASATVSAISNLLHVVSGTCHTDDLIDKDAVGVGTWARLGGGTNTIICGIGPQIDAGATLETGNGPARRTVFYIR